MNCFCSKDVDDQRRDRGDHRRGRDQVLVADDWPWRLASAEVIGRLSPEDTG